MEPGIARPRNASGSCGITRRTLLRSGAAAIAGMAAGIAGSRPAPARAGGTPVRRPRVTTHEVRLGLGLDRPARVAHLTDLHAGHTTDPALLRGAVIVCGELDPDLVVLTGDYLTACLDPLEDLLGILKPLPRPAVAVLGNHDHRLGAEQVTRAFCKHGIAVLRNEHTAVVLERAGGSLHIVGVDDPHTRRDDVAAAFDRVPADTRRRTLVLSHRGEVAGQVAALGGRLVLAGHTHGGQVGIPLLTVPIARAKGLEYIAGWYRVGEARLFVNVGVGTAGFPYRIGTSTRPEVALLVIT